MNLKQETQPPLAAKADAAIERFRMFDGRAAVLVGVSGGADSMALLHFLRSREEESGVKVYAAHINHCLRGAEADRDENFVRGFCEKNGIELFVLRADVRAKAKAGGQTVEEAGREVRYGFFAKKAGELGAAVATAHTLSDSVETQIMNLARGTGLRGLCGIPPVRGVVVRPLIRCTRADTEEYCHCYGIKYVDDSTNFSHDYTRNRVRLDLVPQLYRINPAFDRAAARLMDLISQDEECLTNMARERLRAARCDDGEYDIEALAAGCPKAVLGRCVAAAAKRFTGRSQEQKHISAIVAIVESGSGKTEIAGGCFAQAQDGKLKFTHRCGPSEPGKGFCFPLLAGTYNNGIFKLVISPISEQTIKNFKKINRRSFKNSVDCDKIKGNASVRPRIHGDKIRPAGRNGTKTLKKLFNEMKVPAAERCFVPVAADEDGVIWAGGVGVAERCRVTETTKNAVAIDVKYLEVKHIAE